MDKKMLIRAGIIIGIFVAILGLAYGCSVQQANKVKTPSISNPDEVYATIGGYEITYQILWDEMKAAEGYDYLEQYIDDLAIASYIDQVTDEEVADELEYILYQTKDQDVIAEIQADADLDAQFIELFNNRLLASGLDPLSEADKRSYVEAGIAKYKYVKDYLMTAEGEEPFAISEAELESYYNQRVFNDACVVPVRFNSADEAKALLNDMNIVPGFEDGFAMYLPLDLTEAYEENDTIKFVSGATAEDGETINVQQLGDREVFEVFLKLYNYMNPWEEQIPTNTSKVDFCATYGADFTYSYEEMTEGRRVGNVMYDLAAYTFGTLDLEDEEPVIFSDEVKTFGGNSMLVYKVAQEATTPFEDLTEQELEDLKAEMVEGTVSSSVVVQVLDAIRAEKTLTVYDPDMGLLRQLENDEPFENNGSKTLVAKYGDLDITAETLFNYMKDKAGIFYAIDIAKRHTLVYSDLFADRYGSEHDLLDSDNEEIKDYFKTLTLYKSQYNGGAYIGNGVDPATVKWSEFLYAAFGSKTEAGVVERIFVYPTLIMPYINSTLVNYESVLPYMEDQYENYFSLKTSHILLSVDFDNDFTPDDFSDFLDGLTPEELAEYNAVKAEYEQALELKLAEDDMTLDKIVEEFNDGLMEDSSNVWRNVKAYGFRIKVEKELDINYNTADSLDEAFREDVMEIIEDYKLAANADEEYLFHPSITTSDFGIHKIKGEKGDNFDKPSAMFEETDAAAPEFSAGSVNENDIPTKEQYDLYVQIKFAELMGEETDLTIPESVANAIDALTFYQSNGKTIIDSTFEINSQTMASVGLNIALLENLISTSDIAFKTDNAAMLVKMDGILSSSYFSLFPEEYVKVSDLD